MTHNRRGRGRDKFSRYKWVINKSASLIKLLPINFRIKAFETNRMLKGVKGFAIRYVILKSIAIDLGENVSIHPDVYLLNPYNLKIGNNVSIHPMCYIECLGGIEIGDDVSIAHGATMMSTSHIFTDYDSPIKDQGIRMAPVKINNNVWIGAKATILGEITIETGAIVAAGAVVTKNIQEYTIVGGVPAIQIKKRGIT